MALSDALKNIDWVALGARLQQARKAKGKTQDEAAQALEVSRPTMVSLEQGKRKVSPSELIVLAQLYDVDMNSLLRQRPVVGDLAVVFRARFDHKLGEMVGEAEGERAAALLQRYAENYVELEELLKSSMPKRYPVEYSYSPTPVDIAADEIAKQERDRLSLGDAPIADLRALLETEVGLRVFYLDLPSQIAGMFGYTDDLGGCIAINIKHPHERQRMTLAHEYAHFLTTRTTPDVQFVRPYERKPESERFADAFAARFLMPESSIRRQIRALLREKGGEFTRGDLLHLARYFNVSFEAFGYRLEEMGFLAPGSTENTKREGFKVRKAQEIVGVAQEPNTQLEVLPERYRLLAVQAFLLEEITEGQLMKFLGENISRMQARDVVRAFRDQIILNDEGLEETQTLPIADSILVRSR